MKHLPTAAEIAALPDPMTATVTSSFIDSNGHMNVLHYLEFASLGADRAVRRIGIDDEYRSDRRMGVFTAEHHLRYYGELLEGDEFAIHGRFLKRSAKVVHLMTFVVDCARQQLACTLEIVLVHVNLDSRRPVEMPENIAAAIDRSIATSSRLAWSAPVCGAMGVRD
ncbi:thioesterase family protein [Mycobacterium sp. DL440]|uniref:thioesterase family protein n=1 Tax=Mycobacterium sp. DL440 TaxID=2675523 RepID=UPI00142413B5|nr:thioesterase family protein [Mycobacterium sp. DL440]